MSVSLNYRNGQKSKLQIIGQMSIVFCVNGPIIAEFQLMKYPKLTKEILFLPN